MKLSRRDVFRLGAGTGAAASASWLSRSAYAQSEPAPETYMDEGVPAPCEANLLVPEVGTPDYTLDLTEAPFEAYGQSFTAMLSGGKWPGTEIRYKKGEMFRVLVNNRMSKPTSLHWHGLLLPSLQDGVPNISQLPIEPGTSQYYEFPLIQSGSYYYHSHMDTQEQYGLLGPLIIEEHEPRYTYEEDEVVVFCDIAPSGPEKIIEMLRSDKARPKLIMPFMGAMGQPFPIDVVNAGYTINGKENTDPWQLSIKRGSVVRLRLINASSSTFFRIQIAGLKMRVIEVDGKQVEPQDCDDLILPTSARYDVLVQVPQSGAYTLHGAALGDNKQCVGVIHTDDVAPQVDQDRTIFKGKSLSFRSLRSLEPSGFGRKPDRKMDVILSGNMKTYEWMMNGNSWPEEFAGDDAKKTFLPVKYGEVVQLRLINRSPMSHPMHLHGHTFRVLGLGDDVFAPVMDTIWVPPRQQITIEFLANNPGVWAFHCHNLWHLVTGMMQPLRYVTD